MADEQRDAITEVADELYALDPADFVGGRSELARRLRADKQRALAAEVAKLRRPSPAAWAVNQLARHQRDKVDQLVRLGEELRAAQARALGGADAAELRQAARARRDAVAALTGAAAQLLAARGGGVDANLAGVTATLEAASLDPDAAAAVLAGRLSTELEAPSGFGEAGFEVALLPAAVEPDEPGRPQADVGDAERAVADARRRAEELADAARTAAGRASRRQAAVDDAEAEVARLRARVEDAERRLAEAAGDHEEALDHAAAAAAAAAAAEADLREAEERRRGLVS